MDLLKQRVMSQEKATNQTLNKLFSKIQNEKETRQQSIHDDYMRCKKTTLLELTNAVLVLISKIQYFQFSLLFSPLLSEALRKLEAKRQTAKEKILQLEIKHTVANETWIHTDFSTNESAYNDYIKSHYLQEYSGMTLRFD